MDPQDLLVLGRPRYQGSSPVRTGTGNRWFQGFKAAGGLQKPTSLGTQPSGPAAVRAKPQRLTTYKGYKESQGDFSSSRSYHSSLSLPCREQSRPSEMSLSCNHQLIAEWNQRLELELAPIKS